MRIISVIYVVISSFVGVALGADPTDHLNDKRLSIHTLVREDIFAGWRSGNMDRFRRGEQNIQELLELRPDARADLLAWRGGNELFRAVLAHESNDDSKFQQHLRASKKAFAEAKKLAPKKRRCGLFDRRIARNVCGSTSRIIAKSGLGQLL